MMPMSKTGRKFEKFDAQDEAIEAFRAFATHKNVRDDDNNNNSDDNSDDNNNNYDDDDDVWWRRHCVVNIMMCDVIMSGTVYVIRSISFWLFIRAKRTTRQPWASRPYSAQPRPRRRQTLWWFCREWMGSHLWRWRRIASMDLWANCRWASPPPRCHSLRNSLQFHGDDECRMISKFRIFKVNDINDVKKKRVIVRSS